MQRVETAKIPAPGTRLLRVSRFSLSVSLRAILSERSTTEIRGLPLEASAQALCIRSTMRRITCSRL